MYLYISFLFFLSLVVRFLSLLSILSLQILYIYIFFIKIELIFHAIWLSHVTDFSRRKSYVESVSFLSRTPFNNSVLYVGTYNISLIVVSEHITEWNVIERHYL